VQFPQSEGEHRDKNSSMLKLVQKLKEDGESRSMETGDGGGVLARPWHLRERQGGAGRENRGKKNLEIVLRGKTFQALSQSWPE